MTKRVKIIFCGKSFIKNINNVFKNRTDIIKSTKYIYKKEDINKLFYIDINKLNDIRKLKNKK